jgi:hypothetical protein
MFKVSYKTIWSRSQQIYDTKTLLPMYKKFLYKTVAILHLQYLIVDQDSSRAFNLQLIIKLFFEIISQKFVIIVFI